MTDISSTDIHEIWFNNPQRMTILTCSQETAKCGDFYDASQRLNPLISMT